MSVIKLPLGRVIVAKAHTVYHVTGNSGFFICAYHKDKNMSLLLQLQDFSGHPLVILDFINLLKKEYFSLIDDSIKVIAPADMQHTITTELKKLGLMKVKYIPKEMIGVEIYFYAENGRLRVTDSEAAPIISKPQAPTVDGVKKVRVLIIDDSVTIHQLLTKIIEQSPQLEVVGTVSDPLKAEQAIKDLKPDVMTVDIHMPGMDGVTLLKHLFPKYPIPAVLVSSLSLEEGSHVLNALEAGAVDHIQKPTFEGLVNFAPEIIEKIKVAATVKVRVQRRTVNTLLPNIAEGLNTSYLVGIGSSTGGTEALKAILCDLPAQIPPILIVQHIPPIFSTAFAKRLNEICRFDVREAEDGDLVLPGKAYLAPGGRQMSVYREGLHLKIKIADSAPVNRHKPSVDVLFDSLAKEVGKKMVGIILTGMGGDGTKGLLKMRQGGARTFAQDEATSCVYGMPRVAAEIGAVEKVLPLEKIAGELMLALKKLNKVA